jgi:charged multivesicular body protein 4
MDDIADQMDVANELGEALARPLAGNEMDDGELEDELALLEQEMLDEQFLDVDTPAVPVAATPPMPAPAVVATPMPPSPVVVAPESELQPEAP